MAQVTKLIKSRVTKNNGLNELITFDQWARMTLNNEEFELFHKARQQYDREFAHRQTVLREWFYSADKSAAIKISPGRIVTYDDTEVDFDAVVGDFWVQCYNRFITDPNLVDYTTDPTNLFV